MLQMPTCASKVYHAHRDFKRKRENEKAEQDNLKKRQHLDDSVELQIRATQEASELLNNQIEFAIDEAGKLQKCLDLEQNSLGNFLNCMSSCKDNKRMQELIKESQLSRNTIIDLEKDIKKTHDRIMELKSKKN